MKSLNVFQVHEGILIYRIANDIVRAADILLRRDAHDSHITDSIRRWVGEKLVAMASPSI